MLYSYTYSTARIRIHIHIHIHTVRQVRFGSLPIQSSSVLSSAYLFLLHTRNRPPVNVSKILPIDTAFSVLYTCTVLYMCCTLDHIVQFCVLLHTKYSLFSRLYYNTLSPAHNGAHCSIDRFGSVRFDWLIDCFDIDLLILNPYMHTVFSIVLSCLVLSRVHSRWYSSLLSSSTCSVLPLERLCIYCTVPYQICSNLHDIAFTRTMKFHFRRVWDWNSTTTVHIIQNTNSTSTWLHLAWLGFNSLLVRSIPSDPMRCESFTFTIIF